MTRVIFYSNLADKKAMMLNLVQQALAKRHLVTVLAEDEPAASAMSNLLWHSSAASFLPNVLAADALAAETPVVFDWQEKTLFQDDILINLTQQQLTVFSRFRQIIELVSNDEEDKAAARLRFKFYRDRGYEIQHHNQADLIN